MNLAPAKEENFRALEEAISKNTRVPFIGIDISSYPHYLWNKALKRLHTKIASDRTDAVLEELTLAKIEIDHCDILEKHFRKGEISRQLCNLLDYSRFHTKNPDIGNLAIFLLPRLFPKTSITTMNLKRIPDEVFRRYNLPFGAVMNHADKNKKTEKQITKNTSI